VALLHNIAADRELREGDQVNIIEGSSHGRAGVVVGFDLVSDRPIVVQYREGRGAWKEKFSANEVEIKSYTEAPNSLEPLPTIRVILAEMKKAGAVPAGRTATLRMADGTSLTIVAKGNQDIRQIYESGKHQSVEARAADLLRNSYVTRLPHLMQI